MKRVKERLTLFPYAIAIMLIISFLSKCKAQSITYSESQDITFTKDIKNDTEFSEYVTKNGSILKIGDPLKFGRPSTNSGAFTYLYVGKFSMGNAMLTGIRYLPATLTGEDVIIENIFVYHTKMSWKSPLTIMMYVKDPNHSRVGAMRTIMDYEMSVSLGEVINPNEAMNRQEAIAKLKESKDLLDLNVITQSKYDSIKATLMPIITKE